MSDTLTTKENSNEVNDVNDVNEVDETNTAKINITLTSCLYQLKNRHGKTLHLDWFRYFIQIVNRFYLVIYTSENEYHIMNDEIQRLPEETQRKIKVILKPYTEFYNYKYEKYWISNNNNPACDLHNVSDWRLNMVWCEKVHFVRRTIEEKYFDTEYYGWCDIGYFRDTISGHSPFSITYSNKIRDGWPNSNKINRLHKNKVYYGLNLEPDIIRVGYNYHIRHFSPSNIDNNTGIPKDRYIHDAHIISGGFYIAGREKALWWCSRFQEILERYITNNVVVQNEQHIIAHCVFMSENANQNNKDFCILKVNETHPDKLWFLFRDFLM